MTVLWKQLAVRRLGEAGAPRAFARENLKQWLEEGGISTSDRTLFRAMQEWENQGVIARPAWGVYLNMQARPLPLPEEAVAVLRPEAVISLSSVLSQAGALNNPSYWVSAVLPSTSTKGPVDIEMADGRMLRFAYMRPDLIIGPNDPQAQDALQAGGHVPRATPEKALLDWLYLSSSARGAARWPLPALHDLDIDDLDNDRLDRLAVRMDLVEPLEQLRSAFTHSAPRVAVKRSSRKMR